MLLSRSYNKSPVWSNLSCNEDDDGGSNGSGKGAGSLSCTDSCVAEMTVCETDCLAGASTDNCGCDNEFNTCMGACPDA